MSGDWTDGRDGEAVHLWAITSPSRKQSQYFESLLDTDEVERASKFHFPVDRHRYTVSRGALRHILALCTGQQPEDLVFSYSATGKPYLSPDSDEGPYFNVSHCRDMTLIALSQKRRVGVDVERIRELRDYLQIAERHFSDSEQNLIRAAAAPDKHRLFLVFWTRREAWAKAMALDLNAALAATPFPPFAEGGSTHFYYQVDSSWYECDLRPSEQHVGALCVEGNRVPIITHTQDDGSLFD